MTTPEILTGILFTVWAAVVLGSCLFRSRDERMLDRANEILEKGTVELCKLGGEVFDELIEEKESELRQRDSEGPVN